MATTGVTVVLQDTSIGIQSVNEGVAMLILPMSAASDLTTTPALVTTSAEAEALPDYSKFDANAQFQISEFYSYAGSGSKLWLLGYNSTETQVLSALDMDTIMQAVRLTTATLWDNRPRLIGFVYPIGTAVPEEGGLLDDLTKSQGAIQNIQTFIADMFGESYRMVAVLDAGRIGTDITQLPDGSTNNAYAIALAITTPNPVNTADVGRALGVLVGLNPAQSIGQMAIGSVSPADYFVNGTTVQAATNVATVSKTNIDDIGSKQYLFTRTRPGNAGAYYNDGATLNLATNALSSIEAVRVANGVCDDAEQYFQQLLNTNIPVVASGDIEPGYKAAIEATFRSTYIQPRLARGDASEIDVTVQAKNGNFVQSRALAVTIRILPNATLREAFVTTFYVSSLT